jgi:hypothetical protein
MKSQKLYQAWARPKGKNVPHVTVVIPAHSKTEAKQKFKDQGFEVLHEIYLSPQSRDITSPRLTHTFLRQKIKATKVGFGEIEYSGWFRWNANEYLINGNDYSAEIIIETPAYERLTVDLSQPTKEKIIKKIMQLTKEIENETK